jgi:hypothetical protein
VGGSANAESLFSGDLVGDPQKQGSFRSDPAYPQLPLRSALQKRLLTFFNRHQNAPICLNLKENMHSEKVCKSVLFFTGNSGNDPSEMAIRALTGPGFGGGG